MEFLFKVSINCSLVDSQNVSMDHYFDKILVYLKIMALFVFGRSKSVLGGETRFLKT